MFFIISFKNENDLDFTIISPDVYDSVIEAKIALYSLALRYPVLTHMIVKNIYTL